MHGFWHDFEKGLGVMTVGFVSCIPKLVHNFLTFAPS